MKYSPLDQELSVALSAINAIVDSPLSIAKRENTLSVTAAGSITWRLKLIFMLPLIDLPNVYLAENIDGVRLAHVDYKNKICYSDHEGEGFNPTDIANVIAYAVESSIKVLEESLQKSQSGNFQDLIDEFEGYWATIPGHYPVRLNTEPVSGCQLYGQLSQDKKKNGVRNSGKKLLALDNGTGSDIQLPRRKINFYLIDKPMMPPNNYEKIEGDWIRNLLFQAGKNAQRVSEERGEHIFLFSQQRSGGQSLFGIMFKTSRQAGKIIFTQVQPFGIQRTWREYLLARTGAKLFKYRIAIIGCGALGSRVADQLALSGIDELLLIDPEYFSHDNTYRHVLGSKSVGRYKVDELKSELESKRTGLTVHAFPVKADQWLSDPKQRESCQTIVLTTGKLALEREITRRAFTEGWTQRLVSGWLEPLGLGGHVMTSKAGVKGCMECLHADVGGSRAAPRIAFLEPNQKVSRNLTGCGGRFMPYSATHATETALLICKAIFTEKTGYSCWAGNNDLALSENLKVSRWHEKCHEKTPNESVYHSDCPCCNS